MQELLNKLHATKECFEKTSSEEVKNMNNTTLLNLCLNEKIAYIEQLNKMNNRMMINERLDILSEKQNNHAESTRDYLNSQFK